VEVIIDVVATVVLTSVPNVELLMEYPQAPHVPPLFVLELMMMVDDREPLLVVDCAGTM
jgi:hypothetical protein